jgi:hypothetical protein
VILRVLEFLEIPYSKNLILDLEELLFLALTHPWANGLLFWWFQIFGSS